MSSPRTFDYDVIVAGGGPAGSTAARVLAQGGLSVLIAERSRFPRFRIGESLLPSNMPVFQQLGLTERLKALPHTTKAGVEFGLGHAAETLTVNFRDAFDTGEPAVNLERAALDSMLLEAAREAGAIVAEETPVRAIHRLTDGEVEVTIGSADLGSESKGEQRLRCRYLVDASGPATLVGRHLGLRKVLPGHRRVAYFAHAEGVERLPGERSGFPSIFMLPDAWFWIIPLDEHRTSLGVVMDHETAKAAPVPADQRLRWAIHASPLLRQRTRHADLPEKNRVAADFSYRCAPYAGAGFFMVGDAATFVDPIFSTGVCLGMRSAIEAAGEILQIQRGATSPDRSRRRYRRFVETTTAPFFKLIGQYYEPAFRDLLLAGEGPLQVHRAILSVLGGHVFPRASRKVRWRMRLFNVLIALQGRLGFAPHHPTPSLLELAETANTGLSDRSEAA